MVKKKKRVWATKEQLHNLSAKTMQVRVLSLEKGLEIYNDIKIIRIVSRDNNLMIMSEFQPVIGEINGNVTFISEESDYGLNDVKAFFCFRKNVMKIIIKEDVNVL